MSNTKIIAGTIVIIIIFAIGFWGCSGSQQKGKEDENSSASVEKRGEDELVNLKRYKNSDIQFRYPKVLQLTNRNVKDTSGWSNSSTQKGDLIVELKLDLTNHPKTNLSGATLTVGKSGAPQSVSACMKIPEAPKVKVDSVRRAGSLFIKSEYSEAGAGNLYHIRQFRTLHQGKCYSIEEMVHSTNIRNYPPERGVSEFDSTRVWKALGTAWQTFSFSQ